MCVFLHPDRVDRRRVDRWLVANGCRDHVALEPVILKGNFVEYTAMCRRDRKSVARMPIDYERGELAGMKRKRLRIRVPLGQVA